MAIDLLYTTLFRLVLPAGLLANSVKGLGKVDEGCYSGFCRLMMKAVLDLLNKGIEVKEIGLELVGWFSGLPGLWMEIIVACFNSLGRVDELQLGPGRPLVVDANHLKSIIEAGTNKTTLEVADELNMTTLQFFVI
ncbi:hypothetical protein LAZ67_X004621 [Cordylochernes scorpioides]|uniref:Uncharacterized protein n=1 Tax=Cordylochernes scorpioides TaxID=51811 RepID=A0ABY6LVK2_9ARAC|nr:hypothetical protein LAZ67_X004621 [Cordylochernes scorpioides]